MNDSHPPIQISTLEALCTGVARHRFASWLAVLLVACLAGRPAAAMLAAAPAGAAAAAAKAADNAPPAVPAPPGPGTVLPAPPTGGAAELPGADGRQGVPPPRAAAAKPLPTIGLDEVKVGQRGYGLSVFAGGEPERFEVEVIGVMRNISPDMSYILARLSGRGLESSGVAAGMSGSPVFLGGRLAGAGR